MVPLVAGDCQLLAAADREPAGTHVLLPCRQAAAPCVSGNPSVPGNEARHRGAVGGTGEVAS